MAFYQRKHVRAQWHNYGKEAWYFITLCAIDRQCIFGTIESGVCVPHPIGDIIEREWDASFAMRPSLVAGNFQLMPNHLHALFKIDNSISPAAPTYISRFINGFKSACTRQAILAKESAKLWQRNYHEHIVRNEAEWAKIDAYITQKSCHLGAGPVLCQTWAYRRIAPSPCRGCLRQPSYLIKIRHPYG